MPMKIAPSFVLANAAIDARSTQTGHRVGELAGVATLLCDLVGRIGCRSESGTGPDATFKNFDHDGHLHAIRSCISEARGCTNDEHGGRETSKARCCQE